MEELEKLQATIRILQEKRQRIEREIDSLHREIDDVKQDSFGLMNNLKMLIAQQISRGQGLESLMGEAYARARNKSFKSAQEYIDHLKESIDEARDAISKIDNIRINIEAVARDLSNDLQNVRRWLDEAQRIVH